MKHSFVIHGILAFAAVHISTCVGSETLKKSYECLAALELNVGLKQFMIQVQHVTSENVEALFAFSTIISQFNTFQANNEVRQLLRSEQLDVNSPTSSRTTVTAAVQIILRWLRTLRGAQTIVVPGWRGLQSGPLRVCIQREFWSAAIPISDAQHADKRHLKTLEAMWSSPRRPYRAYFDTLRQAWQELCKSFALVWKLIDEAPGVASVSGPSFDWTAIFYWPVQCSLAFAALLEEQCVEAWVLMGHYTLQLAEVKGIWWPGESAISCLTTAALVIGTDNWEWIAWPATKIGLDLERLRPFALDRPKIIP